MEKCIVVKKSKFGKGIFAKKDFKIGELICKMKGKRVKGSELGKEAERNRNLIVDPLQIGTDEYLILNEPYLFINHSCNPNAGLKNNVELIAIKNIREGKEIFFDYSTTWYEGMECRCGNNQCRKLISNFYTIPKSIQKKYRKLGIIPDFIKK